MAHLHTTQTVQDDDLYFSIDPSSKTITFLGEDPLILAVGDHNSERYTFELPRYIEGHDMSMCNQVEVHYINLDKSGTRRISDIYEVDDFQIAADDDNVVMFTWLLSQNAATYVGSLSFAIRFACKNGTRIEYNWKTGIFSNITVIDSTDNSEIVVEQYSDILQSWYMKFLAAEDMGINAIERAKQEAIDEIKSIDVVVEVEKEVLDRIADAGERATKSIEESIETADARQEAIIVALLDRIPVYTSEAEEIIKLIPEYNGETEEAV